MCCSKLSYHYWNKSCLSSATKSESISSIIQYQRCIFTWMLFEISKPYCRNSNIKHLALFESASRLGRSLWRYVCLAGKTKWIRKLHCCAIFSVSGTDIRLLKLIRCRSMSLLCDFQWLILSSYFCSMFLCCWYIHQQLLVLLYVTGIIWLNAHR